MYWSTLTSGCTGISIRQPINWSCAGSDVSLIAAGFCHKLIGKSNELVKEGEFILINTNYCYNSGYFVGNNTVYGERYDLRVKIEILKLLCGGLRLSDLLMIKNNVNIRTSFAIMSQKCKFW